MTSAFGFVRAGALGALLATLAVPAQAQRAPLELTWRAPPECPEQGVVLDKVRKLLGSQEVPRSALRAEGHIVKAQEGYRLELVLHQGSETGERRIVARRCSDLAGAAAVALALLYSEAVAEEAAAPPSRAAADATTQNEKTEVSEGRAPRAPRTADGESTESGERVEPTRRPAQGSPRSFRVLADVPLGTLRFGPLPELGLGIGGGLGLATADWSIRALAQVSRSQELLVEGRPGYGAEARLAAASLLGCRDVRAGAFGASGCVTLSLQVLRARGFGRFVDARTRHGVWPSGGLAALVFWQPIQPLALLAGASAELHFARPRVTLEEVGLVRKLPSTGATIFLVPEWSF